MAKSKPGQTSTRAAAKAKAGKKSGAYQEPPARNLNKKAASEAGEQQFYSHHQLTQQVIKTVFDKKKMCFVDKIVDDPVPFIWDPTRKRFVFSPGKDEG